MIKIDSKVEIKSIVSVVPKNVVLLSEKYEDYGWTKKQADRIKKQIGINKKHIASQNQTTFDFMKKAMDETLKGNKVSPEKIDAIIVVTQTPDYNQPGNSKLLQASNSFRENILCLDISSGCSGFTDGLLQAFLMLENLNLNNILLLVGDTISKVVNQKDRATAPLFGDAASCIMVSKSKRAASIYAAYGTDGSGFKSLYVRDGGFRNPSRNLGKITMDGNEVMLFSITKEPKCILELLNFSKTNKNSIDYVVLHQANNYIVENIRKRTDFNKSQVLSKSFSSFGNTSSASIPLSISFELNKSLENNNKKFILSGFGVGLSWSTIILDMKISYCPKIFFL